MRDDPTVYPYSVAYSTESGSYRRATLPEISQQLRAQAEASRGYRAWKTRTAPDKMDKVWANYVEMVHLVQRAPFPPKRSARSWDLRQGRTRKAAPAEAVLSFVGRDPEKHTRQDRVQW